MNFNAVAHGAKKRLNSAHKKGQKSELFQTAKIQTEFDKSLGDSSEDSKNEEELIRTKT